MSDLKKCSICGYEPIVKEENGKIILECKSGCPHGEVEEETVEKTKETWNRIHQN